MCVIVVQPAGVQLSGNKFRNCWDRNRDGGGYSYVDDGKVLIKKGHFDSVTMLDEYREDVKAHPESPFLIHFRISTSGLVDAVNTHPHRVRPDLVMAHNGHISGYGSKEQSDTLEFVALVLSRMPDGWEDDELQVHLIERYISGDKIALLRADGEYGIINEDAGNWQDGLWFSNKSWTKPQRVVPWINNPNNPANRGKAANSSSKTSGAGGGTGNNVTSPSAFTACGWDDDDMYGAWGKDNLDLITYFDETCAFCDQKLNEMDAEFCIALDAWYPVCMECAVDNEKELVDSGAMADALDEVWDEVIDACDDVEPNQILLQEVVDAVITEEDTTPATSGLIRLTANVFDS